MRRSGARRSVTDGRRVTSLVSVSPLSSELPGVPLVLSGDRGGGSQGSSAFPNMGGLWLALTSGFVAPTLSGILGES